MTFAKKNIFTLLLITATVLVAVSIKPLVLLVTDESATRVKLNDLGVLATTDGKTGKVLAVNFSVIKDKSNFQEAVGLVLGLKAITSLNLDGMPVSEEHVQKIGKLSSLASISLSSCAISSDGLKALTALKNLETLNLSKTQVNDADLKRFVALKKLTSVDLSSSKVSRELSPLASLPKLKLLLLSHNVLEDTALTSLSNAPALSRLLLIGAEYLAEDMQALQTAIPTLVINE